MYKSTAEDLEGKRRIMKKEECEMQKMVQARGTSRQQQH